jgi:hypothetical protein
MMNSDNITVSTEELQAYETALLAFLDATRIMAAQLEQEGHALGAPLRAELHKAILAQASWRAARWIALASAL